MPFTIVFFEITLDFALVKNQRFIKYIICINIPIWNLKDNFPLEVSIPSWFIKYSDYGYDYSKSKHTYL